MAKEGSRSFFDLNTNGSEGRIDALAAELGAIGPEVAKSFARALNRTAGTLRKMSSSGLRDELGLARVTSLRKRLKAMRLKRSGDGRYTTGVWFGLNDFPISHFQGKVEKTSGGAAFTGKKISQSYPGAFIGKSRRGKKTIFKRHGKGRLPLIEQSVGIKDKAEIFIEDVILYEKLEEVFYHHFTQDLRARVKYQFKSR